MREDPWLAERLGHEAWWVPDGATADDLRDHAATHAPALYQARVDAHDVRRVRELGRAGMTVVDLNLTMARLADPAAAPELPVTECAPEQADDVREIAAAHYDVSRFHMDDRVGAATAARIKRDWVQAYLAGERGERLLVVERDGRAVGFLAVLSADGARVVDLMAVHTDRRGSGVGRALVTELIRTAPDRIEAGTQAANVRAVSFYERLGFRAERARYVLHLHAEES